MLGIVVLVGGFFAFNSYIYTQKQGEAGSQKGYKDTTYLVEGESIPLVNGAAESAVAGSASKTITKVFGNEAEGDLNGDGVSDIAFIITQETGGTGVFYYVVVGLKTDTGYQGTNAVFLGDRIAPQSTEIQGGKIVVNYADRKPDEPMAASPSVGVSKYLSVSGTTLHTVEQ